MYFVFGHRLMGKTDVVPGRFHVATKFYHVNYLPLVPVSSHLIFSQSGKTFRGIKIPLSGKSTLCAWSKTLSVLLMVVGGIFTLVTAIDPRLNMKGGFSQVIPPLAATLAGVALFAFMTRFKPFTHASADRARRLCHAAKLTDEQIEKLLPDVSDGFPVITDTANANSTLPVLPVESV